MGNTREILGKHLREILRNYSGKYFGKQQDCSQDLTRILSRIRIGSQVGLHLDLIRSLFRFLQDFEEDFSRIAFGNYYACTLGLHHDLNQDFGRFLFTIYRDPRLPARLFMRCCRQFVRILQGFQQDSFPGRAAALQTSRFLLGLPVAGQLPGQRAIASELAGQPGQRGSKKRL